MLLYVGKVTPPADMVDAARKSLSAEGFDQLMRRTEGRAPTPAELCAAADQERENGNRVQRSPP